MELAATNAAFGLSPESAQGVSLLLFVLTAFLLLLVVAVVMKRRASRQQALPGAGIVLLVIGLMTLISALLLKLSG